MKKAFGPLQIYDEQYGRNHKPRQADIASGPYNRAILNMILITKKIDQGSNRRCSCRNSPEPEVEPDRPDPVRLFDHRSPVIAGEFAHATLAAFAFAF